MPTKRGYCRLCKVWGSKEAAKRDHDLLQKFLQQHRIAFEHHRAEDGYGREYWLYKVQAADLCCAQAVIPALQSLQNSRVWQASA